MTAEQKQLLIKDLCARLPYGVKIQSKTNADGFGYKYIAKVKGIVKNNIIHKSVLIQTQNTPSFYLNSCNIEEAKPILFPLDAIDKEIEIGGEKVCVNNLILNNTRFMVSATHFTCSTSIYRALEIDEMNFILDTFNRYHIDYRNLIGQGIAISVFDLPENPYSTSKNSLIW